MEPIQSPYQGDVKMWNHIFESGEGWNLGENRGTVGIGAIVPHHIVVWEEINNFYKTLASVSKPKLFVIFGPNHYESGDADIQTCFECVYRTVEGDVAVDKETATELVSDGILARDDKTFANEHAIFSHAPFIKHYFKDAEILPILLKWETPNEEVEEVTEWILKNFSGRDDVFFIASVDFSHYVPKEVAAIHDESSFATISNFDFENVYDLEIDSPASIYAIMKVMNGMGNNLAKRFAHTNTQDFLSEKISRTTSHQFILFFEGESVKTVKTVSVLVLGKAFIDVGFDVLDSWRWRPSGEILYPELNNIRGEEDRFLMGYDYIVSDLPEDKCREFSQNGLEVKFCGGKYSVSLLVTDGFASSSTKIDLSKNSGILFKDGTFSFHTF